MEKKDRKLILRDFWLKTELEPDTTLYEDQLGWTKQQQSDSGNYTDTKDVWSHLIAFDSDEIVGWDLCFYFIETGLFYYIDQMAKILYVLPKAPDADGKSIFGSVDIEPHIVPEEDELMYFEQASEIWDSFTINGKDMKYILEHSVLVLST